MEESTQPPHPVELETLVERPSVRVCQWRSIVVQAWSGEPLPNDQELVREVFESIIAASPDGFHNLGLIRLAQLPGSPAADVRERSRWQMARLDPHTHASALVIDVPSPWGRTVRAFMRALMLLNKVQTPTRIFGETEPALSWIYAEGKPDAAMLAERDAFLAALQEWWV